MILTWYVHMVYKLIVAASFGECEEQCKCTTQHPGFHPVCINRWVLQTTWYQYKQQYKDPYDGAEDKRFILFQLKNAVYYCFSFGRRN